MHIKISKTVLAEALNSVASVVASKTSLAVLQNVKISVKDGQAKFTCSDLDTTLIATVDCEVVEEGETTLPVKLFAAAVGKVIDGNIEIVVDPKTDIAKLAAGTSRFRLTGIAASEFPKITDTEGSPVRIQSSVVREMLRKTSFAMSIDETRKILNSVLMDFSSGAGKAIAVATDGRRLAKLDCMIDPIDGELGSFIIPKKAIEVLSKKLPKDGDCYIVKSGSMLKFTTAKFDLYTKLCDGEYPNYMQVIPRSKNFSILVDRAELIGALDRVSVFVTSDCPQIIFTFCDNQLVLNSKDSEVGTSRDEVPIKYDGEKIEMAFNPNYFRDALCNMDEDEVEIALVNNKSPAVIKRSGSDDYTYVVMPLRTN